MFQKKCTLQWQKFDLTVTHHYQLKGDVVAILRLMLEPFLIERGHFRVKSLVAIQKGIFLSHELVSNILYQKKNWIKIVSCTLLYRTVLYVYFVTENWDAYSQVNHFPFLHLIQILYLEMANIIKICLNKRYKNIRFKLQFEAIKLSAYYENYG